MLKFSAPTLEGSPKPVSYQEGVVCLSCESEGSAQLLTGPFQAPQSSKTALIKQEKRRGGSSDSDFETIEGELDRDIKERDELAARIRKREKEKTRNVLEQKREVPDNKVSS